jgi:hypothetical protein
LCALILRAYDGDIAKAPFPGIQVDYFVQKMRGKSLTLKGENKNKMRVSRRMGSG